MAQLRYKPSISLVEPPAASIGCVSGAAVETRASGQALLWGAGSRSGASSLERDPPSPVATTFVEKDQEAQSTSLEDDRVGV
jgi:hypothetical protein